MPDAIASFLTEHERNWLILQKVMGWHVERDEKYLHIVRLTLPARDGERYVLRCLCDGYPEVAPDAKFVNAAGSESDRAAWPAGNDEFYKVVKLPPNSFLCTDLVREGLARHPEWRSKATAWNGKTHTLMNIFNYVQQLLKSGDYQGRVN